MIDIRGIDNETLTGALKRALGEVAGRGRPLSDEQAAAAIGVEVRSFRGYRQGQQPPRAAVLLRMLVAFGPEFANEVLALCGLHATVVEPPEQDVFQLNQAVGHVAAELGDALADGRVDHLEEHRICKKLKRLRPAMDAFLAKSDAAPPRRGPFRLVRGGR